MKKFLILFLFSSLTQAAVYEVPVSDELKEYAQFELRQQSMVIKSNWITHFQKCLLVLQNTLESLAA
jgi:hypothetical protein